MIKLFLHVAALSALEAIERATGRFFGSAQDWLLKIFVDDDADLSVVGTHVSGRFDAHD